MKASMAKKCETRNTKMERRMASHTLILHVVACTPGTQNHVVSATLSLFAIAEVTGVTPETPGGTEVSRPFNELFVRRFLYLSGASANLDAAVRGKERGVTASTGAVITDTGFRIVFPNVEYLVKLPLSGLI